ncbi:FkbM family methyltransferase [Larkinella arboricola]|uniref:FkbM family methyltransferase n=1 Tax=Larkinella arboricola TaxID=643671 RepID=A0A327X323_LARAB|nr:FkbM family methyltransferase [Larkinella arboricola]RAJ99964.1 FkbM family methyltransferase [Larkinella arboricola]
MIDTLVKYVKRKLERRRLKSTFKEYDYQVIRLELPQYGQIEVAQWLNPLLEKPYVVSIADVNFYKEFTKEGDFIIDIGAHMGDMTLPMALAVGKSGLVLAFDPNPIVYKILEKNASLNRDKTNIDPYRLAIATNEGEYFYNSSEATFSNGGISAVENSPHGKYGLKEKIQAVNLERFLNEKYQDRLSHLSLIKIDTEGLDIEIIKSIETVLTTYKPTVIFECFKRLPAKDRYELYDSIQKKGYYLYYIEKFEADTHKVRLKREDMTNWKHFDIVATPFKWRE